MNYNVILHLDSADPNMFRLVVRNAQNYLNALPNEKFELHVVANGGGATLFASTNAELRQMAGALMARGVKFKICANALTEHGINHSDVWAGCAIVPAGLVEVVRLQRKGFAYIKP